MRRRHIIKLLGGAAAWPLAVRAQQGGRKYVIGRFSAGSAAEPTNDDFTEALRELGWVEGENVVFERRYAENQLERLPELAADLVRLKVDLIAADGTLAPLAAKRATSTIPIVMTVAGGLARRGGNVTGMSLMAPELGVARPDHPISGHWETRCPATFSVPT
jgi:ABC-type uncharacterized transport system substrate-binding protein